MVGLTQIAGEVNRETGVSPHAGLFNCTLELIVAPFWAARVAVRLALRVRTNEAFWIAETGGVPAVPMETLMSNCTLNVPLQLRVTPEASVTAGKETAKPAGGVPLGICGADRLPLAGASFAMSEVPNCRDTCKSACWNTSSKVPCAVWRTIWLAVEEVTAVNLTIIPGGAGFTITVLAAMAGNFPLRVIPVDVTLETVTEPSVGRMTTFG
jgi:hypothetical protein